MRASARRLLGLAVLLAAGASLVLLGPDSFSGTLVGASSTAFAFTRHETSPFLAANRFAILIPLSLPVGIALVPWLLRRSPVCRQAGAVAAILMSAWALAASMSIGLYYAPAALVLWVAVGIGRMVPE